jgi:hypothetical protein
VVRIILPKFAKNNFSVIKDIERPKVEDIAIAAVPHINAETGVEEWYIYLLNLKPEGIRNVLISSRGYGKVENEDVKTSELRHHIAALPAHSYAKVEPIMPELFKLNNQFWVSFYANDVLFDKKYVFLPESIVAANMTEIPLLGCTGVLLS